MAPAAGDATSSSIAALPVAAATQELPIEGKTVKALTLLSAKRAYELFAGNHGQKVPADEPRCGRWLSHTPDQHHSSLA